MSLDLTVPNAIGNTNERVFDQQNNPTALLLSSGGATVSGLLTVTGDLRVDKSIRAQTGTLDVQSAEVSNLIVANGVTLRGGAALLFQNLTAPPAGANTVDLVIDRVTGQIYRQS